MCRIFRLFIAALHFNENGNKEQRQIKKGIDAGKQLWRISYKKSNQLAGVIKCVKADSTYGNSGLYSYLFSENYYLMPDDFLDYVQKLLEELMKIRHDQPTVTQAIERKRTETIPGPLTDSIDKIDKEIAIQQHTSRFN